MLIAAIDIGPVTDCRDIVWSRLADFPAWVETLPLLDKQQLINADPVGRGTLLLQHWSQKEESWQVHHWHPGQRLELILQGSSPDIGIRFDLDAGQDSEHIRLKLEADIRCTGILALVGPLCTAFHKRRLQARFTPFLRSLQQNLQAANHNI